MQACPCGTEKEYNQCCEPFHQGEAKPSTAEELMRARYSAFVKNQINFIAETHVPGTKDFNADEAREWATSSEWKGLQVISTKQGEPGQKRGTVEFKALYADQNGNDYLHHEIANFKNIEDTWYYDEGQIVGTGPITRTQPKVGRNEPCPCGSGKKFKKCCGA